MGFADGRYTMSVGYTYYADFNCVVVGKPLQRLKYDGVIQTSARIDTEDAESVETVLLKFLARNYNVEILELEVDEFSPLH